ncbi:MAG: hypothetical protein ACOCYE_13365 [Pseudomonadota bacterium]
MAVIARSRLVSHRLRVLERQRAPREVAIDAPPAALPGWAAEVLVMAGMTVDEVAMGGDTTGPRDIERAIEAAEEDLLRCGATSLEEVEGLAEAALNRLRRSRCASGSLADADAARSLALLERLSSDLARLRTAPIRGVG